MIIKHEQVGDISSTEIDFGNCVPSEEELLRVSKILGIKKEQSDYVGGYSVGKLNLPDTMMWPEKVGE